MSFISPESTGLAPLPLRLLVAGLHPPTAPRVRTALVALGPASYAAAQGWAPSLGLAATHLGLSVAKQCQAHGHVSLDAGRLLSYALALLPNPDTPPTDADPATVGAWVWGIDALLAKLSEAERAAFWYTFHGKPSYRPPLVLALPAALLLRFGPADPAAWGAARFVQLP